MNLSARVVLLFDRICCRSADCLNRRQRLSAPIAYYPKTNAIFRIDLRLDLVPVRSLLLLSGDIHLNPGPVCQSNEVCKVIQRSWIVQRMVRFSPLVFPNVITGHMYYSCELPRPCSVMVFPVWFSTVMPVMMNYSYDILPQVVERCSVTYYEFSESESEGERGRKGHTRRRVYTEQFLINLQRSSTKTGRFR